jgi:copper(I)-binding protein
VSSPRQPRPVSARPRLRRGTAVLVAGVLPLALSACGAGRDAQTYQERSQADASNTAVGALALRGVAILPPEDGRTYAAGDDAEAVFVVTNNDDEPDTLVEVTAEGVESVEVLVDGDPGELEVPALGSTEESGSLRLVSLEEELSEGQYITMTFRFEDNGTVEVPVPVAVSGRTDRPVYTGGEGEEGEPALQAPAGGEEGEESGGDEGGAGGEGEEGNLGEAEGGQAEDEGETAPRSDEAAEPSASAEPSAEAEPEGSAEPAASATPAG